MMEPTVGAARRASDRGASSDRRPDPHGALRVVPWSDGRAWDRFVTATEDATLAHLWGWKGVMERAYRHRTSYLAAVEGAEVRGVLPLVWIHSRIFGRHLVSMPFLDYGGLCTGGNRSAERALLEHAIALAEESKAVLQLRHVDDRRADLPRSLDKVTMVLELGTDEEDLWKRLRTNKRGEIRKGRKLGVEASIHGEEAMTDFYSVFSRNMRDLGSPVHGKRFFSEILEAFGERAQLVIARQEDRPIGAGLMLLHRDAVSVPWSSSLREFFWCRPNMVLYWESMAYALRSGYRTFDFGRSSRDSGTFRFKHEWGAHPVQLHWHYHPAGSGPPDDHINRRSWAVRLWKRVPVRLANAVGPMVRRAIPN